MLLLTMVFLSFRDTKMKIIHPPDAFVMSARFLCSILMHLNVESDIWQGQLIMKFVTNHPDKFIMPKLVFAVGLMQMVAAFSVELACITFLSTIASPIWVIIKFMALC